MTAERFSEFGSLYALENQQWKKIGNGTVTLITNIHNPSHCIVRIDGKEIDEDIGQVFQCKPKTKPKGNKSYILKGNNTKTNREFILAARFKSVDTATSFRISIENAFNLWQESKNGTSRHKESLSVDINGRNAHGRSHTMAPDEIRKTLATKEWNCKLCTSHNIATAMKCKVCLSPRLIMLKKINSVDELSEVDSIISDENGVPAFSPRSSTQTPKLNKMNELSINAQSASINTIYGDISNVPVSPMGQGSFDWSSADANDKLSEQPNPDNHDIDSTKKDFIRILTTIESNITHQDPLKLFEDLSKVAKRLMRKDVKYRTLDLKNPVVQERLIKIAGVDAYLKYLGFEEDVNLRKMICPDDQPPRSVITTAQEVCKDFLDEWKKKQHIFDLLSQSSKNILNHDASSKTATNDDEKQKHSNNKKEDDNKQQDSDEFTLRQLVWAITSESTGKENQTSDVLLLCHSVFAESSDLLKLLIERFHGETSLSGDSETSDNKKKDLIWNTQVKVGSMLSSWMKTFWEQDFENQPQLMEDIEIFFESLESTKDKRVSVLLKKMRGIYDMQYNKYQETLNKKQIKKHKNILDTFGKPKNFSIADQKAKCLAEQFTLMHFKAFKSIAKRECLGQSWKKSNNQKLAPNILAMIKLFNQTAKWVQILILTQPNIKKRAKIIKLCIQISIHMKEYRNFSGSCAFHSALTSTPIHRLKNCWSLVSNSDIKKFEGLKKIFKYSKNFPQLRKLHHAAHAPAILHTGLFLQDLVGIDEGQNDHTKNGRVNFKKLLKLHEKIDTIAMYQQEEYAFNENLLIQMVIREDFKAQQHIDDDFLFKISCSVKASDSRKR